MNFFIQWIDASADALTDKSLLPTTLDTLLGKYDDGTYFNPFLTGLEYEISSTETPQNNPMADTTPFNTVSTNKIHGSIGNVNYFVKNGSEPFEAASDVDFGLFTLADAAMQVVFEEYETELDAYNDLAEKYNTAFESARTDNTVEVPALPCPPNKPSHGDNVEFKTNTAKYDSADQESDLSSISKDTIYYSPLNIAIVDSEAKAKNDNRRLGHLYANADASDV